MRTRTVLIVTGAALALALALVLTLPSLTLAASPGAGRSAGSRGMGSMGVGMGGPQQSLVAIMAQVLGVPQAEVLVQLQSGATLAAVAGDKAELVVDTAVQARADRMAALVADGRLTQAQADANLAAARANITARMSAPWTPRGAGAGAGMAGANGDGVCDGTGAAGGRGPRGGR